jgi:hypothetical protein
MIAEDSHEIVTIPSLNPFLRDPFHDSHDASRSAFLNQGTSRKNRSSLKSQ